MDAFEQVLLISEEEIEFSLEPIGQIPWADYWLNPRMLRGSDFLMRWSQGAWSEERLVEAVNDTEEFFALPYGPSGVAPDNDVRAFELYFERLEAAGLGNIKRPDLLIYPTEAKADVERLVHDIGGEQELPFTRETDERMRLLINLAIIGVECENSLWLAARMPDFNKPLTPMARLGGKPGLKKNAVLPTIIIKDEDREPLERSQAATRRKIHVWHVFYDLAFGLSLTEAERLIADGLIEPTDQVFQAPGGATTQKRIFKFYHHYAYKLGRGLEEPSLEAAHVIDKNGHILPYVKFKGGKLELGPESLKVLRDEDQARENRN